MDDGPHELHEGGLAVASEELDEMYTCSQCNNGGFCPRHSVRTRIIPPEIYVASVTDESEDDPSIPTKEEFKSFFRGLKSDLDKI